MHYVAIGVGGAGDLLPGTVAEKKWAAKAAAKRAELNAKRSKHAALFGPRQWLIGLHAAETSNAEYVPYRNSKLTMLLKQSLGGNAYTTILCTMTPAPIHKRESISTLKFAQTCKLIRNAPQSNVVMNDKLLMEQYRLRIMVGT